MFSSCFVIVSSWFSELVCFEGFSTHLALASTFMIIQPLPSIRLLTSCDGSDCQTWSLQKPWQTQDWTCCWASTLLVLVMFWCYDLWPARDENLDLLSSRMNVPLHSPAVWWWRPPANWSNRLPSKRRSWLRWWELGCLESLEVSAKAEFFWKNIGEAHKVMVNCYDNVYGIYLLINILSTTVYTLVNVNITWSTRSLYAVHPTVFDTRSAGVGFEGRSGSVVRDPWAASGFHDWRQAEGTCVFGGFSQLFGDGRSRSNAGHGLRTRDPTDHRQLSTISCCPWGVGRWGQADVVLHCNLASGGAEKCPSLHTSGAENPGGRSVQRDYFWAGNQQQHHADGPCGSARWQDDFAEESHCFWPETWRNSHCLCRWGFLAVFRPGLEGVAISPPPLKECL